MIRATLDTNVIVSGMAGYTNPRSAPGIVLRRARRRGFELVVSLHILGEVERALAKPYYIQRLGPKRIAGLLAMVQRTARLVELTVDVRDVATHPADDLVIAAAVSGGADDLVTGDRRLRAVDRYQDITFLTPAGFLAVLDAGLPPEPDR